MPVLALHLCAEFLRSHVGLHTGSGRDSWRAVSETVAAISDGHDDEVLAGYRDDWSDEDYEETEDGRYLSDGAWDRAVAEEERKLRAMVTRGEIKGRGKGKALMIQECTVERFGHTVGVAPEDFLSYRVVPDSESAQVEAERKALKYLRKVVSWHGSDDDEREEDDFFSRLPGNVRHGLREATVFQLVLTWVELRCVEALVADVAEHFNGIDPLRPVFREKVDSARTILLRVQEWFKVLQVEVELREPLDDELQELRDWALSIPSASL